jgi:hypothetical protein
VGGVLVSILLGRRGTARQAVEPARVETPSGASVRARTGG